MRRLSSQRLTNPQNATSLGSQCLLVCLGAVGKWRLLLPNHYSSRLHLLYRGATWKGRVSSEMERTRALATTYMTARPDHDHNQHDHGPAIKGRPRRPDRSCGIPGSQDAELWMRACPSQLKALQAGVMNGPCSDVHGDGLLQRQWLTLEPLEARASRWRPAAHCCSARPGPGF